MPDALISGSHEIVRQWKRSNALITTWRKRPDLLKKTELTTGDLELLYKNIIKINKNKGVFHE
ncbi:MAG TPA: hypothetical protein DC049_20060 [Spirochaetia bacterium]|nr:hypothetical protein [Spirochaetia bacterium]